MPDKIIYKWLSKYENFGIEGLKSNTGKSKGRNKGLVIRKPKNKIEELELQLLKKDIEIARLKKRLCSERSWSKKGIRYYIQQEYKIIDDYKNNFILFMKSNYFI